MRGARPSPHLLQLYVHLATPSKHINPNTSSNVDLLFLPDSLLLEISNTSSRAPRRLFLPTTTLTPSTARATHSRQSHRLRQFTHVLSCSVPTHTMTTQAEQHRLLISPLVGESAAHNTRTLSTIRSLTSSLTGLTAGTLALSSLWGFAFYLAQHVLVSVLIAYMPTGLGGPSCGGKPGKYFYNVWSELWGGDVVGGMMGFVLTWTLAYNLVV